MRFTTESRPRISFERAVIPDSGAAVPVIGLKLAQELNIPIDTKRRLRIAGAGNEPYKVEGSVKLHCTVIHSGIKANIRFLVSSSLGDDIFIPIQVLKKIRAIPQDFPFAVCKITDAVCHEFKILRDSILTEFRDVMSNELSATTIKTIPKDIILKPGRRSPIQCAKARPVQFHIQESA